MLSWRATPLLRPIATHAAIATALVIGGCAPFAVKAAGHTVNPSEKKSRRPGTEPTAQAAPKRTALSSTPEGRIDNAPSVAPVEPDPPVVYATIPDGGRSYGAQGGIAVEALSESGHWLAYCHPPAENSLTDLEVDARGTVTSPLALSFQFGDETLPIEALLAVQKSGRHAVVQQNGKALLVDALLGQVHDLSTLSPDLRADQLSDHRSFAFTPRGLALLTKDKKHDGHFLPLPLPEDSSEQETRDLEAMARALQIGPRKAFRIQAEGDTLVALTLPEAAGEKDWPVPRRIAPTPRCGGRASKYDAFSRLSSYRPDKSIEVSLLRLPKRLPKEKELLFSEAPGFVMSTDSGWVRREDSGRTVLVRGGTQKQIASSRCGARFLHSDEKTGLFLVACEQYRPVPPAKSKSRSRKKTRPKFRFDLYLIRPGFVRNLKADMARTGVDVKGPEDTPWVSIRPGASAALVDFRKRTLSPLEGSAFVLATGTGGALIRRGKDLFHWDRGKEAPLNISWEEFSPVTTSSHSIALGSQLFNLDGELRHRTLIGSPLVINDAGFAVVPKEPGTSHRLPRGPLLLLPRPPKAPSETPSPSPTP